MFIVEELFKEEEITILEMGSGMGILGATFLTSLDKKVDYLGMEVDDLLIDLAASMADVIGLQAGFVQGDAVRPQMLKESDVVISDLPVGYYPDDAVASRHQVASSQEHTYAHHLLMEQGLKYLKSDGYAIFLAPSDFVDQSSKWLVERLVERGGKSDWPLISLPENLFASAKQSKTNFYLTEEKWNSSRSFLFIHLLACKMQVF